MGDLLSLELFTEHRTKLASVDPSGPMGASAARWYQRAVAAGSDFMRAANEYATAVRLEEKAAGRRAAQAQAKAEAKRAQEEAAHNREILAALQHEQRHKTLLAEAKALGLSLDKEPRATPKRQKDRPS